MLQKIMGELKEVYNGLKAMPKLDDGPQLDDFAVNHREPPLKTLIEGINVRFLYKISSLF